MAKRGIPKVVREQKHWSNKYTIKILSHKNKFGYEIYNENGFRQGKSDCCYASEEIALKEAEEHADQFREEDYHESNVIDYGREAKWDFSIIDDTKNLVKKVFSGGILMF